MKNLFFAALACLCVLLTNVVQAQTCNVPAPVITESQGQLATTQTFDSYAWKHNGSAVAGGNQPTLAPTLDGNYTVKVGLRSQNFTLVGRDNNLISNGVKLYPNPSNGSVNLSLPADAGTTHLSVLTPTGNVVYKQQLDAGTTTTTLNLNLPNGLYYMQLTGGVQQNIKFVITN